MKFAQLLARHYLAVFVVIVLSLQLYQFDKLQRQVDDVRLRVVLHAGNGLKVDHATADYLTDQDKRLRQLEDAAGIKAAPTDAARELNESIRDRQYGGAPKPDSSSTVGPTTPVTADLPMPPAIAQLKEAARVRDAAPTVDEGYRLFAETLTGYGWTRHGGIWSPPKDQ